MAGLCTDVCRRTGEHGVAGQHRAGHGGPASWCNETHFGHDWLEVREEHLHLIVMIDDATSRVLAGFAEHDTAGGNMRLLWRWLERWIGNAVKYTAEGKIRGERGCNG